jgi:hypothetical protein
MLRCWEGGCHYRPFHVIAELGLHGTAKLHLCSSPFFMAFLLLKIYDPISLLCELINYVALLRVLAYLLTYLTQTGLPKMDSWVSVLENETQYIWTPHVSKSWFGCPFWKMKPSTSGLPLVIYETSVEKLTKLENETQYRWTPTYWILGCPFWKMKPITSGLPCIEVLVWLSVLENETQYIWTPMYQSLGLVESFVYQKSRVVQLYITRPSVCLWVHRYDLIILPKIY